MARIDFVRSGGFAGLRLQTTLDTTTEPDPEWYDEQLAHLDSAGPARTAVPGQPDRFHYSLVVVAADLPGGPHRVEFAESAVPEPLQALVDRLETRAHSRPAVGTPVVDETPGESRLKRAPDVVETTE